MFGDQMVQYCWNVKFFQINLHFQCNPKQNLMGLSFGKKKKWQIDFAFSTKMQSHINRKSNFVKEKNGELEYARSTGFWQIFCDGKLYILTWLGYSL